MANEPINELGHTEYPKWVGEKGSPNRKIVNDKFEEEAFYKEFAENAGDAPTSGWGDSDKSKKTK